MFAHFLTHKKNLQKFWLGQNNFSRIFETQKIIVPFWAQKFV